MYEKFCSYCGQKLTDFYNTGMLSCPNCYYEFEKEITAVCKKMHGRSVHAGKTPKYVGVNRELLLEYKRLTYEREKAGIDGDFNKMTSLSEQLLDLKETLKDRGIL